MKKNTQLNAWFWRWHLIAGLFVLPFFILLSLTGAIYLFKDDYEASAYQAMRTVSPQGEPLSLQAQFDAAKAHTGSAPGEVLISDDATAATQFKTGFRSSSAYVYVDPYTGDVTGEYALTDTLMFTIRKLHGELLFGDVGTKVVELVASWIFVLLLTGLFIWWPKNRFALAGLFTIRVSKGKRILYRDLHAVIGFWSSSVLLVILLGGFPWTDLAGNNFKQIRNATGTGWPEHWFNSKGLTSNQSGDPLTLDQMAAIARAQNLEGDVSLVIPSKPEQAFTVKNANSDLSDWQVMHFDQYSGSAIKTLGWDDVGALSTGRMIVMELHQGQLFGPANWWIVFISCILFVVSSIAGLVAYLKRKPKQGWGLPKVPDSFVVNRALLVVIAVLMVALPMFGISVLLILAFKGVSKLRSRQPSYSN